MVCVTVACSSFKRDSRAHTHKKGQQVRVRSVISQVMIRTHLFWNWHLRTVTVDMKFPKQHRYSPVSEAMNCTGMHIASKQESTLGQSHVIMIFPRKNIVYHHPIASHHHVCSILVLRRGAYLRLFVKKSPCMRFQTMARWSNGHVAAIYLLVHVLQGTDSCLPSQGAFFSFTWIA
jgi:hypothetical protein